MNLTNIIQRETPAPWSEGDNIPWNEPGFSQRMLKEHLSQEHDHASRRAEIIEQHITFLHQDVLEGQLGAVLDLGCGPGLYAHRLARLGHKVHGIDFSPASIAYAREAAAREGLTCSYELADLREAAFGQGYELAMLIYGEFNVFSPQNARKILMKARSALKPGGRLVLEPSPEAAIRALGVETPYWYTSHGGLFSAQPHLLLGEAFWDEPSKAATNRYYLIEGDGTVTRYATSYQAYSDDEFASMLSECGFEDIRFWPNLTGTGERSDSFITLTAVSA
jgi:SAM-dependent methyltransferase